MKQELDMRYFFPEVLQAVPGEDFTVYAYFNDGYVRKFDVKSLIEPNTVFAPLADKAIFENAITVMNGTVAWDIEGNWDNTKCIDLDPFVLFEQPIVLDPLRDPADG